MDANPRPPAAKPGWCNGCGQQKVAGDWLCEKCAGKPPAAATAGARWKQNDIVVVRAFPEAPARRAVLMKHAPYYDRAGQLISDGWYVSYPDATEMQDCHGGWVQARCMEEVPRA